MCAGPGQLTTTRPGETKPTTGEFGTSNKDVALNVSEYLGGPNRMQFRAGDNRERPDWVDESPRVQEFNRQQAQMQREYEQARQPQQAPTPQQAPVAPPPPPPQAVNPAPPPPPPGTNITPAGTTQKASMSIPQARKPVSKKVVSTPTRDRTRSIGSTASGSSANVGLNIPT